MGLLSWRPRTVVKSYMLMFIALARAAACRVLRDELTEAGRQADDDRRPSLTPSCLDVGLT
jgi:hypothetical protein